MSAPEPEESGLAGLRAGRARLAERVQPPWWYLAGFAVALALACAVPFGSRYLAGIGNLAPLAALVVFYLLQGGLSRVSGVAVGTRTLRYPSGRVAGIALIAVTVAAIVAESLLIEHDQAGEALVVGIFAVAVGVVCQQAHLRGIRRDLRAGAGGGTV